MKRIRTIATLLLLVAFMATASSCSLFKKGCNCPTWEKQPTPHK